MIDEVFEQADLSAAGLNIRQVRANLSSLVDGLEGDRPVVVNVRNKPTAVLLDLAAYRNMRDQAFAYQLLQEAEAAAHEPKFTIDELEADLDQHAAELRAERDAQRAALWLVSTSATVSGFSLEQSIGTTSCCQTSKAVVRNVPTCGVGKRGLHSG